MVNIGDPETQEHRQDRVQKDFSFPTDQTIFFFFFMNLILVLLLLPRAYRVKKHKYYLYYSIRLDNIVGVF